MPKGVEHDLIGDRYMVLVGVESLMPKGVEHTSEGVKSGVCDLCRISDAERR